MSHGLGLVDDFGMRLVIGTAAALAAVRAAERIRDLGGDPPGNAYFAASCLSRCIPIVEKADKTTREERDKQVGFYGATAVAMLREAVANGFEDAAQLKKDKNLDPLRGREDFQKLLRAIEFNPRTSSGYSHLALVLVGIDERQLRIARLDEVTVERGLAGAVGPRDQVQNRHQAARRLRGRAGAWARFSATAALARSASAPDWASASTWPCKASSSGESAGGGTPGTV